MTLDLSAITFSSDMFETNLPDGSTLRIYKVDELIDNGFEEVPLDYYVFEIETDDSILRGTSIIGMQTDYYAIDTDHTEYYGKILNSERIAYCKLEVSDGE